MTPRNSRGQICSPPRSTPALRDRTRQAVSPMLRRMGTRPVWPGSSAAHLQ